MATAVAAKWALWFLAVPFILIGHWLWMLGDLTEEYERALRRRP